VAHTAHTTPCKAKVDDNPLLLANRKVKRLPSVLVHYMSHHCYDRRERGPA